MKSFYKQAVLAGVTAAALVCAPDVSAQGGGGGGGGGRGGGGRGMDLLAMADNYQATLGVTDATEWAAVRTLVEKVLAARAEVTAFTSTGGGRGGGGGGGGRGGGGGGGGGGLAFTTTSTNEIVIALVSMVSSGTNTPAEIKVALDKYRQAKATAEADLKKAQDALKAVLKVNQEAIALRYGLVN